MTSNRKDRKMKRSTADRLLEEIQERILEVNENPDYCYRVTEALVFGSYVNDPGREMLSDLDIAIRLEAKYPRDSPQFKARQDLAKTNDYLLMLVWQQEEIYRFIRNRNGYISIHKLGAFPEEDEIILSDKTMQLKTSREESHDRVHRHHPLQ